jgi:hypothetical protein
MIAQQQQEWQHLGKVVAEELGQLCEAAEGMESGDELELAVQAWQRKMGQVVMEALCQRGVQRSQEAPQCCEQPMRYHSRRSRVVTTVVGTIRLRRRYYRCLACSSRAYPADEWLGWRGAFSHRVQDAVAWECAALPYREAVASLEKLAGIALSVHAAEDIVAHWGAEPLEEDAYQERIAADMVVEIDGTTTHLEDGWREVKVGTFFSWDRNQQKPEPEAVSHVADWQPADHFRRTLWEEAVVRGAPTARSQAVIGDGAPWVWETASYLFPHATQILDWYHLTQHLWEAAKVVHGEGTPETKELEKAWETQVWEGRSEAVEDHLRELLADTRDDQENTLRRCADYLQTHQHRLRYHLFRAMGWPVGSGVVEGACKHVIGLRFKRKSTRWTKTGARAVLHLRLDRLNGRWQQRSSMLRLAA